VKYKVYKWRKKAQLGIKQSVSVYHLIVVTDCRKLSALKRGQVFRKDTKSREIVNLLVRSYGKFSEKKMLNKCEIKKINI
jgi:hypothetical protein